MRDMLQGFTMYLDGSDYGIDTEEIDMPIPTPMTQEYRGGGMDLGVNLPMGAIEPLEITVKMAGQNPDLLEKLNLTPGTTSRVTFRAAVLSEQNGAVETHLYSVEGCLVGSARDQWKRSEKVGFEFKITGIRYFRHEVDTRIVHMLQAYPPKRVVGGIDQLASINQALGY